MKLEFTKKEMEKLLELLTIADWVLTSQDIEDDERKDDHINLLRRIYTEAHKSGMKKEIIYDEDLQEYYPDEEWEEETQVRDFIEEFEDATFWEELIFRLTQRDIERETGGKTPKNLEEQMALFTKIQIKYEEEFEKHNLDNLELIKAKKPVAKKRPTKAQSGKSTPKAAIKKQ